MNYVIYKKFYKQYILFIANHEISIDALVHNNIFIRSTLYPYICRYTLIVNMTDG